jgi:hypothetical protein
MNTNRNIKFIRYLALSEIEIYILRNGTYLSAVSEDGSAAFPKKHHLFQTSSQFRRPWQKPSLLL